MRGTPDILHRNNARTPLHGVFGKPENTNPLLMGYVKERSPLTCFVSSVRSTSLLRLPDKAGKNSGSRGPDQEC